MKRTILFVLICLVASAAFAFSSAPGSNKAPDFKLRDLAGKDVSLKSFQGKTVVLEFFQTTCPACREEMPQLNSVYKKLRSKELEILGISIREYAHYVSSFVDENKIVFPVLLDERGDTANAYKVRFIPSIFIVDKTGKIVFRSHYLSAGDMEREIKKAVK
jgi:peroxiredoxin